MSLLATNETVGCAELPDLPGVRLMSDFISTSPTAAMTSRPPIAATIAGPRREVLPLAPEDEGLLAAGGGVFPNGDLC